MNFVIIGIGQFGRALALYLTDLGFEVSALDIRETNITPIKDIVANPLVGDATDIRVLRGQHDVEMHGRRIARGTVERAMATVVLSIFWIVLTTMLLLLLEPGIARDPQGALRMLFLEVSAYTTTGFDLGVAPHLSPVSRCIVALNMLFGRVGMFTFMLIFIKQKDPAPLRYPETRLPLN